MIELITEILPGFDGWLSAFLADLGQYFAAGCLMSVIFWAIGYSVHAVFRWLEKWTA